MLRFWVSDFRGWGFEVGVSGAGLRVESWVRGPGAGLRLRVEGWELKAKGQGSKFEN